MHVEYEFLPELFLRTPYYSFARYDLERVPNVLAHQVFRNAIWLASPGFYQQLQSKHFNFNHLSDKEKNTLYKYYNRMCFRPTPFGSFAAFTNLAWGCSGKVQLEIDEQVLLHLLPDQTLLKQQNRSENDRNADTKLTKNPTLYRFGSAFRFINSRPDGKGRYRYTVDAFRAEPFYQKVINLFKAGYYPTGRLREWIKGYLVCTQEEADEYLDFLLDEQILIGPAAGKLIYQQNDTRSGFVLPGIDELWQKATRNQVRGIGLLADLTEKLREQLPATQGNPDQLFYAALERPLKSGGPDLDEQLELKSGLKALQTLSIPAESPALRQFITAFSAKFDLEKVPIMKALDPDAGLNYNNLMESIIENDVLKDLRFPLKVKPQPSHDWTDVHKLLLKAWRHTGRDHYAPLRLQESDLLELEKTNGTPSPPTLAIMYRKTENELLIELAGGATAASLIGRFSMFSEQTANLARQIADAEQAGHPDTVFADISQLTDQHVDNINRRKRIYPYEIPLNVYSSFDYDAQIRPDDLYLSVINGELILESRRLNKRVIPRLATAYNYHHNDLALFRLLCDLQYQGLQASYTLDLEQFFPDMDFYPRVCIGHVILSLARWLFTQHELQFLQSEGNRDDFRQVREFRLRYNLPQRISMGHGDQRLVFDLCNREEAGFFRRCVSGLQKITIQEYLLPDKSIKEGNRPMAGQYVAFMTHGKSIYTVPPKTGFTSGKKVSRDFQLGSGWLYLKVYCTPDSADLILLQTLRPFLNKNRQYIKKWFFIRYNEQGDHLRIRLNIEEEHIGLILAALKTLLNANGHNRLIKVLQGDTYRRELERYGPDLIDRVESHFEASSNFSVTLLKERTAKLSTLTEFDIGFFTTYHLVSCFFDEVAIISLFARNMAESFLSEFKADKALRADMDTKFRTMKSLLTSLLENPITTVLSGELMLVFTNLMDQTKVAVKMMFNKSFENKSKLIADLIHMHLNRTFRANPRLLELLVYYCLHKYISSKTARLQKNAQLD